MLCYTETETASVTVRTADSARIGHIGRNESGKYLKTFESILILAMEMKCYVPLTVRFNLILISSGDCRCGKDRAS